MDHSGFKPKQPRRKLNRSQIIDILERNVALYREEPQFVHYLVELAVYLMEYEYDWTTSDALAPRGNVNGTDGNITPGEERRETRKIYSTTNSAVLHQDQKICPYCGANVGDLLICPSCRNLTR
jgi:hypothetical protein